MKTACNFVIVYDFETGGLPSKEKLPFLNIPIVELAMSAIDMTTLEIVDRVDMIFPYNYKEGLEYQPQATEVHQITKTIQDANGIPLKQCYKTCKEWFAKYKNPRQMCTLAGHNIVAFDNPFFKNFFEFMGDDLDKYVRFYIDTMQWAHISALEQIDYKLGTCCQLADIDLVDAHRAQNDVDANAGLFISYVKKLRGDVVAQQQSSQTEEVVRYRETFQLM
jgi:DNA polymerase III alpha subunit (gram-positive type)